MLSREGQYLDATGGSFRAFMDGKLDQFPGVKFAVILMPLNNFMHAGMSVPCASHIYTALLLCCCLNNVDLLWWRYLTHRVLCVGVH